MNMNTNIIKQKSRLLLATLFLLITFQIAYAQKFVIPILPDTQNEITGNPAMFTSQMNWIANNKNLLNIPIVIHVGDITNNQTPDQIQWKTASKGFRILDSLRIPYALALGNHDTALAKGRGNPPSENPGVDLRDTREFNTYFPVSRFTAQKGRYEDNKSDNAWYTFKAGGVKWLVLTLEYCSRQGPVDWANKVISKNPNYNVIIVTHYHLRRDGVICPKKDKNADVSPLAIYNKMMKIHSNVRLVLSGHVGFSAWRDDIGTNGNHIYQLLQDYQAENKGGGYIRLLEIDTKEGTIAAKMYSPYSNQTRNDVSQFSFSNVSFIGRK